MGKHSAADGAVVHPIVATALQQRGRVENGSPVGWPQEPRRGEGIGWPDPAATAEAVPHATPHAADEQRHPDDDGSLLAALDAAAEADQARPAEPARRSGWRRLFGGGSSTSAA
ncbi:hypothetical protein SAMN03159343_1819 [Klenkia marina]|uniref:Uncharacterized protein n=1 Tax=Klenkia marina TaxID=1960309 RepID=A0A1G4XZF5_9ACTN|nr:hypothetical protein [Klenkia marina]SCX46536.1 hypothetical protein SAMN03159343_1819 [Klenkia marina]